MRVMTPRELRKARNEETEVELTKDELEEFEYGVAKAYVAIRDALREEVPRLGGLKYPHEWSRHRNAGRIDQTAKIADAIDVALHPGTVAKGE